MDICLWNKCNNRCLMCTNPSDFWESDVYTQRFLEQRLRELKKDLAAADSILLTGGEPTIHPKFLSVLKFASQNYPDHRLDLLSNGRRFFYEDFTQEVMKTPNLVVAVALHGFNSQTHDRITRSAGSFEQTLQGIRNILNFKNEKLNQVIEIRVVISRLNYRFLTKILKLIKKEFGQADRVVLIFLEVEGRGSDNFAKVGLTYAKFRPYLEKIYPFFGKFNELRLYHFPLCTLPSKFWPYVWRTLPEYEITFLSACSQCLYKKYCLGIHHGYLEKVGPREFRAIKNNFKIKSSKNFYRPIIDIA